MKQTYFHQNLDTLSEEAAATLARNEVFDITEYRDHTKAQKRIAEDRLRRSQLSLGEILFYFPRLIDVVASQQKYMTVTALRERAEVYGLTIQAEAMVELLEMEIPYSQHRTIVGVRVKENNKKADPETGFVPEPSTIDRRLEAARTSVERNGVLKADDQFYADAGLLPPPNSFERAVVNLEQDPRYADERLDADMRGRLLDVVIEAGERKPTRKKAKAKAKKAEPSNLLMNAVKVSIALDALLEEMFELEGEIPVAVESEMARWSEKISAITDLMATRNNTVAGY